MARNSFEFPRLARNSWENGSHTSHHPCRRRPYKVAITFVAYSRALRRRPFQAPTCGQGRGGTNECVEPFVFRCARWKSKIGKTHSFEPVAPVRGHAHGHGRPRGRFVFDWGRVPSTESSFISRLRKRWASGKRRLAKAIRRTPSAKARLKGGYLNVECEFLKFLDRTKFHWWGILRNFAGIDMRSGANQGVPEWPRDAKRLRPRDKRSLHCPRYRATTVSNRFDVIV